MDLILSRDPVHLGDQLFGYLFVARQDQVQRVAADVCRTSDVLTQTVLAVCSFFSKHLVFMMSGKFEQWTILINYSFHNALFSKVQLHYRYIAQFYVNSASVVYFMVISKITACEHFRELCRSICD